MDSRAPRANRCAGFKSQGRFRPDAVSARPMGHLSRRSLSIFGQDASMVFVIPDRSSPCRRESSAAEQAAHLQQRPAQAAGA
jgi:hypothetical protein